MLKSTKLTLFSSNKGHKIANSKFHTIFLNNAPATNRYLIYTLKCILYAK